MHKFIRCLAIMATLLFLTTGYAIETSPLEGYFFVSPKNVINPSSDEKDTHYRIVLQGKSAKELYNLMESKVEVDHCTGAKSKRVGSMQCLVFESKRGYECHFSIDVKNQEIDFGLSC